MRAAHDQFDRLAGCPMTLFASAAAAQVMGHSGGAAVARIVLGVTPVARDVGAAARPFLCLGRAVAQRLFGRGRSALSNLDVVLNGFSVVQGAGAAVQRELRPGCTVANTPSSALIGSYDKRARLSRIPVRSSRHFSSARAGVSPAGALS